MKNFAFLFIVLLLFDAPSTLCGDTLHNPPAYSDASERPNHLEPVEPDSDAYKRLVFDKLLPEGVPMMWMLVTPSFSEEYSVALILSSESMNEEGASYELEYRVAREQIWGYKELDDGQMDLDLEDDVEIELQRAKVPLETAELLSDTWEAVLKNTRYPDKRVLGLDGVTYEFNAADYYGKTWSPQSGVPKLMVDSGELLIEYVKSDEQKRDNCLQRLTKVLEKLQEELD